MTAAKPEEANHKERTMDEALLSRSLRQLTFMSDKLTKTIAYCSENDSEESSKFANLFYTAYTRKRVLLFLEINFYSHCLDAS